MSPNHPSGFTRGPRVADRLTPDLEACTQSAVLAERAGDAAEALEWHTAVPMFERGRHIATLRGLAQLGGELPPWVAARWLVYQTVRCDDLGSGTGDLFRWALKYVAETVHHDLLLTCYEEGGDPVPVLARICGES